MMRQSASGSAASLAMPSGPYFATGGKLLQKLRYGENPHQSAALYAAPGRRFGITAARQIQGKELSYNNINDTDAAIECLAEFDAGSDAACVIVKHANPCGVAMGADLRSAYRKALSCDPVSAFGGIIALNRNLDAATAAEITELFTEVIVAPSADEAALEIVARKKNLRLLLLEKDLGRRWSFGAICRRRATGSDARHGDGRPDGVEGCHEARPDRAGTQ